MIAVSSQNFAIASAISRNVLAVRECWSDRFGEPYWAIEDDHGVIEIALSLDEANDRIIEIKERL
jgi:hypothetical protein